VKKFWPFFYSSFYENVSNLLLRKCSEMYNFFFAPCARQRGRTNSDLKPICHRQLERSTKARSYEQQGNEYNEVALQTTYSERELNDKGFCWLLCDHPPRCQGHLHALFFALSLDEAARFLTIYRLAFREWPYSSWWLWFRARSRTPGYSENELTFCHALKEPQHIVIGNALLITQQ
jgi:hypothetical protein